MLEEACEDIRWFLWPRRFGRTMIYSVGRGVSLLSSLGFARPNPSLSVDWTLFLGSGFGLIALGLKNCFLRFYCTSSRWWSNVKASIFLVSSWIFLIASWQCIASGLSLQLARSSCLVESLDIFAECINLLMAVTFVVWESFQIVRENFGS